MNKAPETNDSVNENKLNFAKKHLGTKSKETKTVGLLWDILFKYRMLTKIEQN